MVKIPSVTIDAGVIAAPAVGATEEEVIEYIETLTDWRRLLDERWIPVYMSEGATEALFQDNLYPLHDSLRRLFVERGIVDFAANDIVQVANALLQLTPSFEEMFQLKYAIVSDLVTEPSISLVHTPPCLKADLESCLVLTALLRNHCSEVTTDHTLIFESRVEVDELQVRGVIEDLEHHRDDIVDVPLKPECFHGTVAVCQTFRDLISKIDESAVWQAAETEDAARKAVQVAVYKRRLAQGLSPEWGQTPPFAFGESFRGLVARGSRATSQRLIRRILRAMAETIDNLNLAATHALRLGAGGNSPQRTRNGDKAWRRDVDRDYHLHYWERADGVIEFASVGPHDDFFIPS
jgi:hypothetical protein